MVCVYLIFQWANQYPLIDKWLRGDRPTQCNAFSCETGLNDKLVVIKHKRFGQTQIMDVLRFEPLLPVHTVSVGLGIVDDVMVDQVCNAADRALPL